jgi:O-antigen/teichoic acid export membrane protein
MDDLKKKIIRGGTAKFCWQLANIVLRLGFIITLARFLDPEDFGLVAMVTTITGIYGLFTSAGLASAMVQIAEINDQQISALFWFNILFGILLSLVCLVTAPFLVSFYSEPRLLSLTVAMSAGFLITAAGTQHAAILQRELRYFALTLTEALSQLAGIAIGIGMAIAGCAYWALVGASIISQTIATASVWLATAWVPGKPRGALGVRSLLHFGGTITLNGVIVYVAYNFEKILLGRFWGADALGIYGRAYQLVNMPTENLNSAIGGVAFAALSRLQNDPGRLKNYFLNGYSLVSSMTIPFTLFGMVFADDLIFVILGPKWMEAAHLLRLLAPTVLIFGIINPLGWLLLSIGLQGRSLRIAMAIAPLIITAYVIGLPYGPSGVAFAYSVAMTLWLTPHVVWCLHDTMISPRDLLRTTSRPFMAGIVAALCVLSSEHYWSQLPSALMRLGIGGGLMFLVYLGVLMLVLGQRTLYRNLFHELIGSPPAGPDRRAITNADGPR